MKDADIIKELIRRNKIKKEDTLGEKFRKAGKIL